MSLSKNISMAAAPFRLVPGTKGGVSFVNAAPSAPQPKPGPDIDAVKRDAFAAGQAKAKSEFEALNRSRQERIQKFEAGLEAYLDRFERQLHEQSLELGLRLAEILVRHALPDREMIKSVMTEALEPVAGDTRVKVRLNPVDADDLAAGAGLEHSLAGRVDIVPDKALEPGDVVMEDGFGLLDARINQRLDLLRTQLKERFRGIHADGRPTQT